MLSRVFWPGSGVFLDGGVTIHRERRVSVRKGTESPSPPWKGTRVSLARGRGTIRKTSPVKKEEVESGHVSFKKDLTPHIHTDTYTHIHGHTKVPLHTSYPRSLLTFRLPVLLLSRCSHSCLHCSRLSHTRTLFIPLQYGNPSQDIPST